MSAMKPVAKDSPLMKAWEAYQKTDDYMNTRKWAKFDEHVDGSLWAAFMEGFNAAAVQALQLSDQGRGVGEINGQAATTPAPAAAPAQMPEMPETANEFIPRRIVVPLADYELLRAYAASLERDARRYRWLSQQSCHHGGIKSEGDQSEDCYLQLSRRDLDLAIDEALSYSAPQREGTND